MRCLVALLMSEHPPKSGFLAISIVATAVVLSPLISPVLASVITAEFFVVDEDNPIHEDAIVASTSARVDGLIDGDLTIVTGALTIRGKVTGSVDALTSGTVRIEDGGTIEGSLRSASPAVVIDGAVMGDVLVTAASLTIGETGTVGSDAVFFGGTFRLAGSLGRDVRGRMITGAIEGEVGRDIDIAVERLTIGSAATVGGDVLYRSPNGAAIADSASIAGEVVALPAQSNFFYGLILTLANIISFLGFLLVGIFALWLLRSTGEASIDAIERNPIKTLLVGIAVVVGAPLALVALSGTLVGLPLALILGFGMLLSLVVGPIPSVAAFGDLVARRRAGLFGAFVLGAVLWRAAIWGLSLAGLGALGAIAFLVAHVWGMGGWVLGGWQVRRDRMREREALPAAMTVDDLPDDFEYPLAPRGSAAIDRDEGD
jgi:cytoskeletal protein CcmA (bactofilin family)